MNLRIPGNKLWTPHLRITLVSVTLSLNQDKGKRNTSSYFQLSINCSLAPVVHTTHTKKNLLHGVFFQLNLFLLISTVQASMPENGIYVRQAPLTKEIQETSVLES